MEGKLPTMIASSTRLLQSHRGRCCTRCWNLAASWASQRPSVRHQWICEGGAQEQCMPLKVKLCCHLNAKTRVANYQELSVKANADMYLKTGPPRLLLHCTCRCCAHVPAGYPCTYRCRSLCTRRNRDTEVEERGGMCRVSSELQWHTYPCNPSCVVWHARLPLRSHCSDIAVHCFASCMLLHLFHPTYLQVHVRDAIRVPKVHARPTSGGEATSVHDRSITGMFPVTRPAVD